MKMKKREFVKLFLIILYLSAAAAAFGKEYTDGNGKICHTFKVEEEMVQFLRIRGAKVLLYKENSMSEPILTIMNKTFVQYLDRDGKNVFVRVHDGINKPVDGWITKYQVESKNDMFNFYYGEPFIIEEDIDESSKIKDIAMDKIVWIVKDVAKLYYEPSADSDYKYEIYFGLRLEAKKQRGDFYFVQIYNSIFQEYRNGWVKVEDTGTYEYFFAEYDKRREQYERERAGMETKISEMETFVKNTYNEIEKSETDRFRLLAQKHLLEERNRQLVTEKRATEDEETRLRAEKIESLELKLAELKSLDEEIGVEIDKLENTMKRYFSDIDKNIERSDKLKLALENIRVGRYEAAESMLQTTAAEEAEKLIEKETVVLVQEKNGVEEDECEPLKKKLDLKMAEFEKVRSDMAGHISREEYNKLYDQYMKKWSEIGELKKEYNKCETFSKNKHIALYNEALNLKKEEEYDEALELLYEAVDIKEDFDEGYFQIVSILITLDEDNSIGNFIDKISDGEKRGKLYYRRALSVKDNYPGKAIRYFEKMSDTYKPETAYYYIGIIYAEKLSDYMNSIKYLRRSLDIDPDDPKTLEAVGAAYLELRPMVGQEKTSNYNLAASYLEKALKNSDKYDYKNSDVLNVRLSQVYNLLGKYTSALKHADTAIRISRMQPFGLAHLEKAKALISMDRQAEAKQSLQKAVEDISTRSEAEYWLKEIGN